MNATKLMLLALLVPTLGLAQVIPGTGNKSLKSTNPNNSAARTTKDGQSKAGQKASQPGDAHNGKAAAQKAQSGKMAKNRAQ